MRRLQLVVLFVALGSASSFGLYSQSRNAAPNPVVYEGARLISGDGSAPIENGAFVVQNGQFTAFGRMGTIKVPPRATRVNLTGKTVIPAFVNIHSHLGWELFTTYGDVPAAADNFTAENVLDHLQRHAYYGVGTVLDAGSSHIPTMIPYLADQTAGKFPTAAQLFLMAGVVPPNGGPDNILIKGTRPRHASYEVLRAPEARKAVQEIASKNVKHIKIWMGDRNGSYPTMPHEVYDAVIDEAHKLGIKVHAHATNLRDQKDAMRAGVDVIVHTIANVNIDDELIALLREKKPYWTPVMGLGDHSDLCDNDSFVDQVMPARVISDFRASTGCRPAPNAAAREEIWKHNFMAMINAGARLVLGTDSGVFPRYSFGWADHHEMGLYARLGLSPTQILMAATSTPAEAMGAKDVGLLAEGKRADFVVLNANPLQDIKNTRQIASVYLRGLKLDREALLSRLQNSNISSH
jgi:imidazolonepropionase-like amidohydrolase